MKLNTQHPLVLAVRDMGIDASHAAAALVGFARQNGCKATSLSVEHGLNAFVDFLFTHPPDAAAPQPAAAIASKGEAVLTCRSQWCDLPDTSINCSRCLNAVFGQHGR
jgi:hypothetical protein